MLRVWHQGSNLSCNKSGCCRLWKVDAKTSSTLCIKTCTSRAFYPPKANLFCNSREWRDPRIILSNQKSALTQLVTTWFAARQGWFMKGKTRNIAFQFVLQQCCKTRCTFYRALYTTWFAARQGWFMKGKTRNIAFQFVLQQCCKTRCTFYRALYGKKSQISDLCNNSINVRDRFEALETRFL